MLNGILSQEQSLEPVPSTSPVLCKQAAEVWSTYLLPPRVYGSAVGGELSLLINILQVEGREVSRPRGLRMVETGSLCVDGHCEMERDCEALLLPPTPHALLLSLHPCIYPWLPLGSSGGWVPRLVMAAWWWHVHPT